MRRGRRSQAGGLLLAAWIFGSALVLGIAGMPLTLTGRRAALKIVRLWARGVLTALRLFTGARVEVRGRARLPAGGCIVAAKHQGMLDILIGLLVLPDPCIVLKRELMAVPIFGWYARRMGMIPIDRGGGAATVRAMNAAAERAVADGRQVLIYPEGTRTAPGAPPGYKSGAAALYRAMNVACAPMATNSGLVWPANGLAKYAGVAVFEVLEPIPPGMRRAAFMAELQSRIETASDALLAG